MSQRIAALRESWKDSFSIKGLGQFISHAENIGYLTGFLGTYGRLILTKNAAVLITDGRYAEKARKIAKNGLEFMELKPEKDFWKKLCKKLKIQQLGFEATHTSVAQFRTMKKAFGSAIRLKKTDDIVEKLRRVKSEEEIKIMRKAARIGDETLSKALPFLKTGISEGQFAWILEKIAREEFGAEGMSFPPIVAFGKNSAVPHHESGNMKLKKNMPILIDFGVRHKKYCSDMTRCFFYGKPTAEWLDAFTLVQKAQQTGIAAIKPGNSCAEPHFSAERVFGKSAKFFTHSFGHGVGLEIHEAPTLSARSKEKFAENMTITAEPGLYFPGKFGIRIEDLLVVKKASPEYLSRFPQDALITS